MIIFIGIISWIAIAAGFCLWDAFIGLPVDFDGSENPPIGLAAFFWPVAIPVLLTIAFSNLLESVKQNRINKEEAKELRLEELERIRIKVQKENAEEEAIYLQQVEQELKSRAQ